MYDNVRVEMARKKLTLEDIVSKMRENGSKITVANLSLKLNKKCGLKFDDAVAIKKAIGSDLPLEVLFEEAE